MVSSVRLKPHLRKSERLEGFSLIKLPGISQTVGLGEKVSTASTCTYVDPRRLG